MNSGHNEAVDRQHDATLRKIAAWKGKLFAEQADRFSLAQDLALFHYNEAAEVVTLADGEPYSWNRILYSNAARLFGGGEDACTTVGRTK